MQSALITGAATGIGMAAAQRLDAAGWQVFAGVREGEDLTALQGEASERLVPVTLDVTDAEQIAAAAMLVRERAGGLDGLVNNAGTFAPLPLELLPIDEFRRQLEVNLTGQVAVTQAFLPQLRDARGRVVFVSSAGGLMALPMSGAYCASKFGLEAVGDVFRRELRAWGIHVAVIEPGSIDTPIWGHAEERAGALAERIPEDRRRLYAEMTEAFAELLPKATENGIPPAKVAGAIERALTARRPRTRYQVGKDARGQAMLARLLPDRLLDRMIARLSGI